MKAEGGKLSIIVAVYKSEKNLRPFYRDFEENLKPYLDDYEIIMVNDDSPDNSWEVMLELAKKDPKIKLVKLSRNFGSVAATFTGMSYAEGDCVTNKAPDLQEPAQVTLDMYEAWKRGANSVIAVRQSREDPPLSSAFSNLYYRFVRLLVTKDMPRGGFDLYFLDRSLVKRVLAINDRNSPITLQILWLGFHPQEVPYERQKRTIGKSSWTFAKKVKLFIDSFIGFSYIPIRVMSVVGLLFCFLSILYALYIVAAKLSGQIVVEGWTSLLLVMLFSFGLIMFTLGILGEYIWRILDAARNRPIAIVSETVGFEEHERESAFREGNS